MSPHPPPYTPNDLPLRLEREELTADVLLRLGFGCVAVGAASWLLLVDPRPVPRLVAAAGWLFGALWIVRFLRSAHASRRKHRDALVLSTTGLTLETRGQHVERMWQKVCRIEQDQDALVVCVIGHDGSELRIDPGFGGLGLDALSRLMYEILRHSQACTGQDKG